MYNSQYYTCEQIDERLLQGYLDDYNTQTGQSLTKEQFLTKLGNVFAKETVIDNTAVNIGYFVCDTAAGTAAKAITAAGYELFQGGSIKVKFTNRNTAGSATLNINSKGAKTLYYGGKAVSASNSWDNGEVVEIYYDGTSYYANNVEGNFKDGIFDISAYNLTEGQPTKYATLAEALGTNGANVPAIFRKGGMQIKYVSTSDNKYVQARCMAQNFTTDVTQWAIVEEGVYVENPEFIYVKTDNENKILWAIRKNGDIFYGAGVPSQVVNYINKRIAELSLDEYEDIVAFLNGLEEGDKTLQTLLNQKVDKEEGKSLIDSEYANGVSHIENPEWIDVKTDNDDKVLEGTKKDGTKIFTRNVKILGNMNIADVEYSVISNPEFIAAWVDENNKVLFGLKHNGKTYIGDADFLNAIIANSISIDEINNILINSIGYSNVDWEAIKSIKTVENPEYINVEVDANSKVIGGRKIDGTKFENIGIETPKINIGETVLNNVSDPENRIEVKTDSEKRIISYRDEQGVLHENVGIKTPSIEAKNLNLSDSNANQIKNALNNIGFTIKAPIDWSDDSYIHIPQKPKCALINITGIDVMPTSKSDNFHAYMEVWDKNGNYFKKKVILNAQGRSSLQQIKKNFAADFCEDDWEGDATTSIKIGNWVTQDSFHFKAYYTDMFKFANILSYTIYSDAMNTFDLSENKPYKEYFGADYGPTTSNISDFNQNANSEAKCVPDGFPCAVYLNGIFYGIFSWQLKKHRDNYQLNKKNPSHIHIDGDSYINMFNGTIDWNHFEIRNPKKLVYAQSHNGEWEYDADVAQAELAGNSNGSTVYTPWTDGSYSIGDIREYNGHLYLNTLNNNTTEPIYHKKNNADDAPDFKNKTGCYWLNVTNTVKVKEQIISVSNYMGEIAVYETQYNNNEITLSELKAEIEKRFWMKWIIEYCITINLEGNADTIDNNTQWITWGDKNSDTKFKWCPCLYDADNSFGIDSTRSFSFGTPSLTEYGKNTTTPMKFVYDYYMPEYKERYAELRNKGVIAIDNILNHFLTWVNDIGIFNYELEYDKWNESPCNRDATINNKWQQLSGLFTTYSDSETSWNKNITYNLDAKVKYQYRLFKSLQSSNINHIPEAGTTTEWWEDITVKEGTYNAGDEIWDGRTNFYRFEALETIIVTFDDTNDDRPDHLVNTPFEKLYSRYPREGGVFDSVYRVNAWFKEKIRLMDIQMDYNN